jgi:hypothetical protein
MSGEDLRQRLLEIWERFCNLARLTIGRRDQDLLALGQDEARLMRRSIAKHRDQAARNDIGSQRKAKMTMTMTMKKVDGRVHGDGWKVDEEVKVMSVQLKAEREVENPLLSFVIGNLPHLLLHHTTIKHPNYHRYRRLVRLLGKEILISSQIKAGEALGVTRRVRWNELDTLVADDTLLILISKPLSYHCNLHTWVHLQTISISSQGPGESP